MVQLASRHILSVASFLLVGLVSIPVVCVAPVAATDEAKRAATPSLVGGITTLKE